MYIVFDEMQKKFLIFLNGGKSYTCKYIHYKVDPDDVRRVSADSQASAAAAAAAAAEPDDDVDHRDSGGALDDVVGSESGPVL